MVVMLVIHIMPRWTDAIILFIVINLSTECMFLTKCVILGVLEPLDTQIGEITTSSAMDLFNFKSDG